MSSLLAVSVLSFGADGLGAGYTEVSNVPVSFFQLDPKSFDWRQEPVYKMSKEPFSTAELWREFGVVSNLFFRGHTSALVLGRHNQQGKVVGPLSLLTAGEFGGDPLAYVNSTQVSRDSEELEGGVMTDFNHVELSACVPNKQFYALVDKLESSGVLVLPRAGVDFSKINRLPSEISSLVVYRSEIGEDFSKSIEACSELEGLFLIGCYGDEKVALPGKNGVSANYGELFSSVRKSLKILVVHHGTPQLMGYLGAMRMGQLRELSVTWPASFFPNNGIREKNSERALRFPKLEKVSTYFIRERFRTVADLKLSVKGLRHEFLKQERLSGSDLDINFFVVASSGLQRGVE